MPGLVPFDQRAGPPAQEGGEDLDLPLVRLLDALKPEKRDGEKRLLTTSLFQKLAEEDEELNLRWSDGVEVIMESSGFNEANIDILQLRAVPNAED